MSSIGESFEKRPVWLLTITNRDTGPDNEKPAVLEGRSNKLAVSTLWGDSPTDNRARAEWVLHAEPGATVDVKVLSERAGAIHRSLRLE